MRTQNENQETVYESNVISARFVLITLAGLALLVAAALVAMRITFVASTTRTTLADGYWTALDTIPPTADQSAQLRALRISEQRQLTEYGWTDRENGVARIPIERAKELLLKRGLPLEEKSEDDT